MTSIDTKERARDARHAIEQAAAANGVYVGGPLDSEINDILIAALEAQAQEAKELQALLLCLVTDFGGKVEVSPRALEELERTTRLEISADPVSGVVSVRAVRQ